MRILRTLFPKMFLTFADEPAGTETKDPPTLGEAFEEAQKEEEAANEPGQEEPSTPKGEGSQEEPGEEEPAGGEEPSGEEGEEKALQALDEDKDFQEAKEALEKEMGGKDLSYAQTKRFRKIYYDAQEGKRTNADLRRELDDLKGKTPTDADIYTEAVKRGLIKPGERPAAEEKKPAEEKFDPDKFLESVPEDEREQARKWLNTFSMIAKDISKMETKEVREELEKYKTRFGELSNKEEKRELDNYVQEATTLAKDKYGIDWHKEIMPEIVKIAKEKERLLPEGVNLIDVGFDPLTLTKLVISEKGYELAKKTVKKETKKQIKERKEANIETDPGEPSTPGNDVGKSFEEIYKEERKREGLERFE